MAVAIFWKFIMHPNKGGLKKGRSLEGNQPILVEHPKSLPFCHRRALACTLATIDKNSMGKCEVVCVIS